MDSLEMLKENDLYQEGKPLKLHMGCGQNHLNGYVNVDYPQSEHNVMKSAADAEADITKDLLFPRFSVDEIRSHHFFEHLRRVTALAQLVKWYHWLRIDGILVIETPDFMGSVKQLADAATNYSQKMAIVRHLVGDQAASWAYHRDMWFHDRFETSLSCLSFHIADISYSTWDRWPHLKSITVTATKVNAVEISDQIEKCFTLLKDSMVSSREEATFKVWQGQLREELKEYLL